MDASDRAIDYWSEDYNVLDKPRIVEAKLKASQALIDAVYSAWRPRVYEVDCLKADNALAELLDALTGGQFSVAGRYADPEKVEKTIGAATTCVLEIRQAHRRTIPLYWLFDRYIRSRNIMLS